MNSITELSDRFVGELAAIDPVRAAFMGVARDSTQITDWSSEGVEKVADLMRRTIAVLDTLAPVDDAERLGAATCSTLRRPSSG